MHIRDKVKEYGKRELLNMEKEVAGIYFSGHPLDEYREDLDKMKYPCIGEFLVATSPEEDGYSVEESEYHDGKDTGAIIDEVSEQIVMIEEMIDLLESKNNK